MDLNSFDAVFGVIMKVSVDIRNISGRFLYINDLFDVQDDNCILNLKKNKYLFQKWCIKVVNNNQRGSPNLAVNLALNEILVHKVGVDIDTPLKLCLLDHKNTGTWGVNSTIACLSHVVTAKSEVYA